MLDFSLEMSEKMLYKVNFYFIHNRFAEVDKFTVNRCFLELTKIGDN